MAAQGRRILICAWGYAPDSLGGAERQAQLQAEEFARRGFEVTVVCPTHGTRGVQRLNGVEVRRLRSVARRPLTTVTYLLALGAFLIRHGRRFHQIFVHHAFLQADVAVLAAGLIRRPVWVRLAASGPSAEIARTRRLARLTHDIGFRGATRIQAISGPIQDELTSIGIPDERIVRIPNGVDASRYGGAKPSEVARLRARLALPVDRVVLLYAGRIARQKGVSFLLDAWTAQPRPKAQLVLVGRRHAWDGADIPSSGPGFERRDWTRDLGEYYRAADVFVLPSFSEGMSNALLEAMASGLAVIATRVGAAEEMVQDGVTGLLVEPGDVQGLAQALDRIIAGAGLRSDLGRAAAELVAARYGIELVVDRIIHESPALQATC